MYWMAFPIFILLLGGLLGDGYSPSADPGSGYTDDVSTGEGTGGIPPHKLEGTGGIPPHRL